jgi:hypothetical protein
MDKVESFTHNGFTVTICRDEMAESPRSGFDNLAKLVCWHRRANLGDECIDAMLSRNGAVSLTAKELVKYVRDNGDKVVALVPLYLYQHGGMTMRCEPFADPWDSGQVGWGYVTQKDAIKAGCVGTYKDPVTGETKRFDKSFFEQAIREEVKTYDDYLTGRVYGYEVTDEDGDHLDSCWGFYGDLDYVRTEAKEAAESAQRKGHVSGGCTATCAEEG